MNNIRIVVTYDGSNYNGFQKQANTKNTIQENIEMVLSNVLGEKIELISSGRTDKGVHALNQVCNFKTNRDMSISEIKEKVNLGLHNDIYIKDIKIVDDRFHSRYNVTEKTYTYKIYKGDFNPFMRKYSYYYTTKLNIPKMEEAVKLLIGTHDFVGFSSVGKTKKSTERTIKSINFDDRGDEFYIYITGDGFLYNMVRIIVGTLLEVSEGKRKPESINDIFNKKDRTIAGRTIPPHGLYLKDVRHKKQ